MKIDKKNKSSIYINQNAGNVQANIAAFNHAASGGAMMGEQLDEPTIYDLVDLVQYNGAEYRGAEIPEEDPFMINQINIPDNMRLKSYDVDVIDDDTLQLSYTTQEPFTPQDSEKFIDEINRFFQALVKRENFHKPFTVALEVMCRGLDENDGHLVYDININGMENEQMKLKENLNNVVETEDKSRESIQPDFADAVREIKDNEEKVAELQRVRKAPKESEQVLSDDIKFILDESLFEYYDKDQADDFVLLVYEDDEELYPYYDEYQADAHMAELEQLDLDNPINQGLIGYARLMRDDEGKVFVADKSCYRSDMQNIKKLDDIINHYVDKNFHESIKNIKGIKRLKHLTENLDYSVDEYLNDIKYYGDGYVTIEKIDLDIDQGNYKFKSADVLNTAIAKGWVFKDDKNEGLCLVSNRNNLLKDSKDVVKHSEITPKTSLRKAVEIMTPDEFQLDRIRDDVTLEDIWRAIKDGKDFYDEASVDKRGFDSAVREKIFDAITQAFNIDYDRIYDTWLSNK